MTQNTTTTAQVEQVCRITMGCNDWQGMKEAGADLGLMDACNKWLRRNMPASYNDGWRVIESTPGYYVAAHKPAAGAMKAAREWSAQAARQDAAFEVWAARQTAVDYAARRRARHLIALFVK